MSKLQMEDDIFLVRHSNTNDNTHLCNANGNVYILYYYAETVQCACVHLDQITTLKYLHKLHSKCTGHMAIWLNKKAHIMLQF